LKKTTKIFEVKKSSGLSVFNIQNKIVNKTKSLQKLEPENLGPSIRFRTDNPYTRRQKEYVDEHKFIFPYKNEKIKKTKGFFSLKKKRKK